MYIHTEDIHNFKAAEQVLPIVFNIVKPSSILDVGCGIGTWLKVAKDLGVNNIQGIDGSYINHSLLKIDTSEFLELDLSNSFNLNKKFDLVICLEVAEHLPEEFSDNLINSLCLHGEIILFSAAIPGQGGQNHFNEQWPDYWQKKFHSQGFDLYDVIRNKIWLNEKVESWYKQNMFLCIKQSHLLSAVYTKGCLPIVHPDYYMPCMQAYQDLAKEHKALSEFYERYKKGYGGIRNSFKTFLGSLKNKFF
jgi:SAM-dependent methyltransferase